MLPTRSPSRGAAQSLCLPPLSLPDGDRDNILTVSEGFIYLLSHKCEGHVAFLIGLENNQAHLRHFPHVAIKELPPNH